MHIRQLVSALVDLCYFQTGAIFSPELLSSFAILAKERGIALVIDETYRDLIPSGQPHKLFTPFASSTDWEWRANFIHLFSFSKSYCVPGHRLGAIVASPILLDHVNTVLDCMQVGICSLLAAEETLMLWPDLST